MLRINDNVVLILALISRNKEFATPSLQAIVLSVEMLLQLGMVFTLLDIARETALPISLELPLAQFRIQPTNHESLWVNND
jgi:hypothetical protein